MVIRAVRHANKADHLSGEFVAFLLLENVWSRNELYILVILVPRQASYHIIAILA